MDEGQRAKIVLPEKLFMFFVCFFADLFEFAATLAEAIPIIGAAATFAKVFGNIMVWPIVQGWLFFRGGRGKWALARNLIFAAASLFEFISFLNAFPLRTISLIIVFILIAFEDRGGGEIIGEIASALPAGPAGSSKVARKVTAVVK